MFRRKKPAEPLPETSSEDLTASAPPSASAQTEAALPETAQAEMPQAEAQPTARRRKPSAQATAFSQASSQASSQPADQNRAGATNRTTAQTVAQTGVAPPEAAIPDSPPARKSRKRAAQKNVSADDAATETVQSAASQSSVADISDVAEAVPDSSTDLNAPAPTAPVRPSRVSPAGSSHRLRRIRPWVWWALGSLSLIVVALLASWFALPIKTIQVSGNHHLSEADVRQLAGVRPGMGWLYYGSRQARGLLGHAWVQSAQVTRQFPDTVQIKLTERQPFMQAVQFSGTAQAVAPQAVAQDGTLLQGAGNISALPRVSGWGPERLKEAVTVARALSRYTVQSVTYTPSGLTVQTASGTVWSGDPNSLVKYAGSISMYPNKKLNIYPWGVSVQQ